MSVGAILTIGYGSFGTVNLVPTLGYGGSVVPPTPNPIPQGGSGHPVYHQGKRKKLTLKDRPSDHLNDIFRRVVAEHYGQIVESDLPKSVKAEAAAIVKPFAKTKKRVPSVMQVDWDALDRDAAAVSAILALWNNEIAQQAIDDDDEDILMLMN